MSKKVDKKSNESPGKVEPLRSSAGPDSPNNQSYGSSKPMGDNNGSDLPNTDLARGEQLYNVPEWQHNGCELVRELHRSCSIVQFFGVTAAVIAFLAFAIPKFPLMIEQPIRSFVCVLPLILAYLLCFNHLILTDGMNNNPKLLLMICWLIYFLDALFLGALVAMTGGPSKSLFIPLFLLIPTAMSCYCSPKRWPFWTIIFTVVITYAIGAYIESTGWVIIKDAVVKDAVNHDGWIRQLISGVFTISCVMIAAYCCVVTHKVRKKYCIDQHKSKRITPNICDELRF